MNDFADFFAVIAQFVYKLIDLSFFGFPSFLVFALFCLALSLVGWVLRGMWGNDK